MFGRDKQFRRSSHLVDFTGAIVEKIEKDVLVEFVQFYIRKFVSDGGIGQIFFGHFRVKILDSAREIGPRPAECLVKIPSKNNIN